MQVRREQPRAKTSSVAGLLRSSAVFDQQADLWSNSHPQMGLISHSPQPRKEQKSIVIQDNLFHRYVDLLIFVYFGLSLILWPLYRLPTTVKDTPQLIEPQGLGTSKLDWRYFEHNKIDRNELQVYIYLHKGTGTKND